MITNTPDFITLSCPSCGAKLEVTTGMNRFACAFCGQEHIVKRTSSTVSLSPVVEAIYQVQTGVDKTAAELAIVRLQNEISELQTQKQNLLKKSPPPSIKYSSVIFIVFGSFILIGLGYSIDRGAMILGIGLLIFGLLRFFLFRRNERIWKESTGLRLNALAKQIAEKQAKLKQYQNLVNG